MASVTIDALRRHAIGRSLFRPTSLPQAISRLGFVQADPLRAPARAQDLTLRHRVAGYRAGDLEQRYPRLAVEEDFFVNYGFVRHDVHQGMHPRTPRTVWPESRWDQARSVLEFVRDKGVVHPRDVDAAFGHGKTRNWFGGTSNASTELLDGMHYRGLLRVARRDAGVRLYAAREQTASPDDPQAAHDFLIDVAVNKYAPLPAPTLGRLLSHLGGGAPQWRDARAAALVRARARLRTARVDGMDWYWPADERMARREPDDAVRLLAPFDPVVWDRLRFEVFWGWAYRFEAYTPAARRKLGHYALPLLWRGMVIGWGNVALHQGRLQPQFGFVSGRAPDSPSFRASLDDELQRLCEFLDAAPSKVPMSGAAPSGRRDGRVDAA